MAAPPRSTAVGCADKLFKDLKDLGIDSKNEGVEGRPVSLCTLRANNHVLQPARQEAVGTACYIQEKSKDTRGKDRDGI